MRRIVFAKTIFVPSMTFSRLAFIIGIVHNAGAGRSVVNHPVSAVQNRQCIRRPAVIQVLTENRGIVRLTAVQQIRHFPAFELLSGFGSCAVQLIGFAFGEVIAVLECAAVVLTAHIADIHCACHSSCGITIVACTVIITAYSANPAVSCNIPCVIAVFNCAVILTDYAANINTTARTDFTSNISCTIAIADRASFIIGTANTANVIAAPKVRIFQSDILDCPCIL